MRKKVEERVEEVLTKRAFGYTVPEVTEEFLEGKDGEMKLLKRKVVHKVVQPDVSAIREILVRETGFEDLSDDELEREYKRLMREARKN